MQNMTVLSSLKIQNPNNLPTQGQGSLVCATMTSAQANALINNEKYNPSMPVSLTNSPILVGTIIYNTDLNAFQIYQAITFNPDRTPATNGWISLKSNGFPNSGVGFATGSSMILPTGNWQTVEGVVGDLNAANTINGFMYYAIDLGLVRGYVEGNWVTFYSNSDRNLANIPISSATFQDGDAPLIVPSGTSANIEVANNQRLGFIYFNTELGGHSGLRMYGRNQAQNAFSWGTITFTPDA